MSKARSYSFILLLSFRSCCLKAFVAQPVVRSQSLATTTGSLVLQATVEKTEQEWKEQLTPEQYYVLREEGTEAPNTSKLNFVKEDGVFKCAGCGAPLFTTSSKFDSGTGWPSFFAPVSSSAISLSTDFKLLLPRTEVSCQSCGGHLGHVFDDGPNPTGQRFCMNGIALAFVPETDDPMLYSKVQEDSSANPYSPGAGQVLPTIVINLLFGGLFFDQFMTRYEVGINSVGDVFPLLPAIFCGVVAAKAISRLVESNQ